MSGKLFGAASRLGLNHADNTSECCRNFAATANSSSAISTSTSRLPLLTLREFAFRVTMSLSANEASLMKSSSSESTSRLKNRKVSLVDCSLQTVVPIEDSKMYNWAVATFCMHR